MAVRLTVAEVAAILNVTLVVGNIVECRFPSITYSTNSLVQLTYPLLITFVTVGVLKKKVNVATWYVYLCC